ncbi:dihydrofolate reductase family protein [Vibrio methylphosphonaticus]|uniref:dihydrofolate reductase family protein n=1 Tax=Vibrio methylphosphonaticus TaxID=2946866 RepID=UPI00202A351D|nr:dihydrofolate reductase family protein [Vibrio methylphosphonaticus]MCL9776874.1 dihydrofolate reductase family protein [Vibrio methylphosphonaticus]
MANIVYIATSLDGFIADKNNNLDWLHEVPNPEGSDFGFADFMGRIDALIMGRNTLDTVLSFDCEWPYSKPVFVLSNTMKDVPKGYEDKVFLVNGDLRDIVKDLNSKGYHDLYIDGGVTIQNFLQADLIDEMLITTIPILLGGGISLFGSLDKPIKFKHIAAQRYADCIVKNQYIRA